MVRRANLKHYHLPLVLNQKHRMSDSLQPILEHRDLGQNQAKLWLSDGAEKWLAC